MRVSYKPWHVRFTDWVQKIFGVRPTCHTCHNPIASSELFCEVTTPTLDTHRVCHRCFNNAVANRYHLDEEL